MKYENGACIFITALLAAMLAAMLAAVSGCAVPSGPAIGTQAAPSATETANAVSSPIAAFIPREVYDGPYPYNRPRLGPPPPGYIRIQGDAVPGWKPSDMLRAAPDTRTWVPLGPRPIAGEFWSGNANASGRVVSIAPHPTDPNIVYIASASGGIWKTVDAGVNWSPLTDELSNLNHGAVTLDPSNPETVYVGTGEYTTSSGGDGLFRSTDGGQTWNRIATTAQVGSNISKIAIDPTNSNLIHVAGDRGYNRSDDGGQTWDQVFPGRCSDLVVNPANPQIIYVARHGDAVYKSTNSGTFFVKLTGGLPTTSVSRILLAISRSQPDILYTAVINNNSGLRGLYKTTNGGSTWTHLSNTPDFPSPQAWYDAFIGVDPTNPNIIYAGGVFPSYAVAGVIRSTNGGQSWTDITIAPQGGQLHPDQHTIAFGPTGTIWVGNDGGVWKTDSPGTRWTNTNATLAITQDYNIALHPTDPDALLAGTQDNGTVNRISNTQTWPQLVGGDGGFCMYDFTTPLRRYTTYVFLRIFRFAGTSRSDITGPWASDPRNFIAPLVMDPNDARTLVGGTNRVWRTRDANRSATWSPISTTVVSAGGTLNAIAVAVGASDTIYTGSRNGRVYVTTNASTWVARSTGLPSGQISDIVIDPTDPATAYVSYHNNSGGRVFRTENLGVTWTDVTGALATGVSVRALAIDWRFSPPDLFVGSGAGIYNSQNGGATWTKDGTDLPNVVIGDLAIDTQRNSITAATFGRGVWRSELRLLCYPDCDQSTGNGVLDLFDFLCFQNLFVTADPYACDCDTTTGQGVCDLFDFLCFQNAFVQGCP